MAHPDDAEFLCAGALIRLHQLGWQIHIATLTAGDCGTTTMSAEQIMQIRRAEGAAAAKIIGGTYHCLEEPDGHIVYDKPTISKVISLFRQIVPTLVFTHAPRDYMIDHEITSQLARCASHIFGAPNASSTPLAGGNKTANIPHLYYCDPIEGIDPFGNPVAPTTLIDISAVLNQKSEALAAHASQREWLRAHQGMDEYLDSMRRHATARGKLIGTPAAEGFIQHRSHGYPKNDLLGEVLKH